MENLDILTVINLYSMYIQGNSINSIYSVFLILYRVHNNMAIANYNQYVCMSSAAQLYEINIS